MTFVYDCKTTQMSVFKPLGLERKLELLQTFFQPKTRNLKYFLDLINSHPSILKRGYNRKTLMIFYEVQTRQFTNNVDLYQLKQGFETSNKLLNALSYPQKYLFGALGHEFELSRKFNVKRSHIFHTFSFLFQK